MPLLSPDRLRVQARKKNRENRRNNRAHGFMNRMLWGSQFVRTHHIIIYLSFDPYSIGRIDISLPCFDKFWFYTPELVNTASWEMAAAVPWRPSLISTAPLSSLQSPTVHLSFTVSLHRAHPPTQWQPSSTFTPSSSWKHAGRWWRTLAKYC